MSQLGTLWARGQTACDAKPILARYGLQARTLKSQCAAKRMNSAFVTSFSPFSRPSFVMTDFIWSKSSSWGTPPKNTNVSSSPSSSAPVARLQYRVDSTSISWGLAIGSRVADLQQRTAAELQPPPALSPRRVCGYMSQIIVINTLIGMSASREVLLGFASARILHALSFADVLDEEAGGGYQRKFSERHSLDFRRYIRRPGSTTPPLTFNLRPRDDFAWKVEKAESGIARLVLSLDQGPILSQVDCQHRLGHITDLDLTLPFMVFLGLSEREEMEVFNTINGKAKGLSSSLLDYHEAQLAKDLGKEKPELLIALHLNETQGSPWFKQLDLGGRATSGLKRRASLRTMQKAVRRFLAASSILDHTTPEGAASFVVDFWASVAIVLKPQWEDSRRHFLTKGIGVYALMGLLADIWNESSKVTTELGRNRLSEILDDFAPAFDWSNTGPLKGLGGETGASKALMLIRQSRLGLPTMAGNHA